jgi:hypothetical protein
LSLPKALAFSLLYGTLPLEIILITIGKPMALKILKETKLLPAYPRSVLRFPLNIASK